MNAQIRSDLGPSHDGFGFVLEAEPEEASSARRDFARAFHLKEADVVCVPLAMLGCMERWLITSSLEWRRIRG